MVNPEFWQDKKVFVTGHTGFKGSWLCLLLRRLGAEVTGYSLSASTSPNLYQAASVEAFISDSVINDIRNFEVLSDSIQRADPEIIFHLAAQPLVRLSYQKPLETWSSNVMGTANLLQAIRGSKNLEAAVMVTTDKVYQNNEWVWPYRESDRLGGSDPYSASKAASELVISSFRKAFGAESSPRIATARAGNVIGGGDWSEDRLFPDLYRAWSNGSPLIIRRPEAVRPWQHVLEPLAGYLVLAEMLSKNLAAAEAYNFGPDASDARTVGSLIGAAQTAWGPGSQVEMDQASDQPHEANLLLLDTSKASSVLGLRPKWSVELAVDKTIGWYKRFAEGISADELCDTDIDHYLET